MKSFSTRFAICIIPLLLAAVAVGWAGYRYSEGHGGFRLGVDLVGGTILVYEIDMTKFPDGKLPEGVDAKKLAATLKRRIDPNDLYNVTIRPVSDTRVEIILPTGGTHQARKEQDAWDDVVRQIKEEWKVADADVEVRVGDVQALAAELKKLLPNEKETEILKSITTKYSILTKRSPTSEFIQDVKEKVSRQGSLEFRIVANERDDHDGIEAAKQQIKESKAKLESHALKGTPPDPPRPAERSGFSTAVEPGRYTYTWVEVGRSERRDLGLDNSAADGARRMGLWSSAEEARTKGEAVTIAAAGSSLLYSREIPKERAATLPAADRDKKYEYYLLTRDTERGKEVTGKYLANASPGPDEKGNLAVHFRFDSEGGNRFYELTSRNAPEENSGFRRFLAVVLDGYIESAPSLNARIGSSGQISGGREGFNEKKVNSLVGVLRSGALPATLKQAPVSENTIGPTLGADTINAGFWSVIYAFIAILGFMAVYYRFAGLVACTALLANLLLTVAFMVVVNATFTLPGLAGLVLMLGMAVDANVLIYERLREERDRGASLALAIRNGYDRALPTIIDTHLSSIFTAIVLYVVGNDQLKGFGVSLTVGLIISLFTSLYMTRLMFDFWLAKGWLNKLSMFRFFSKPNIDFMAIRYYWFTATIVLSLFGLSVFLGRGKEGLNIDFNGGTSYTGRLTQLTDVSRLRELLSEEQQKKLLAVKEVKRIGDDGYDYQITYADGAGRRVTVQPDRDAKGAYSEEEIARKASVLPDLTVEQLFVSDEASSKGNLSKLFTVRTGEKAPDLVQGSIVRLLGDNLERIYLKEPAIDPPAADAKDKTLTRGAKLEFADKPEGGAPVFASKAQLAMLLQREFSKIDSLKNLATNLTLSPIGKQRDDRYQAVQLTLSEPVAAKDLKQALDEVRGEFAQRPQPERFENFDSQLAAETQTRALYAILASWGAILLYLWFRFGSWTFGAAAVLCLVHDLTFTLGIIGFCHYIHQWAPGFATLLGLHDFKIDLTAVAALLTLAGYSTNDTIVVFDRIREVRGKNPELTPQMINDSVNQTLSRTLLASLATWLPVIVLYCFGGAGVHLFAFVMVVGVIVGTYSSIYIASPLLLIFGEGRQPVRAGERLPQPVG